MVPPRPSVMLRMATPLRYLSAGYFKAIAGDIYGGDFRKDTEFTERYVRRMAPPSLFGYVNQLWALAGWTSASGCIESRNRRSSWRATTIRSCRS